MANIARKSTGVPERDLLARINQQHFLHHNLVSITSETDAEEQTG
jgi:hypothetical protein